MTQLPIIEQRRIEARILKNVHEVIETRSGTAEADAVIGEAVSRAAIQQGAAYAERLGHTPDFDDFAAILPDWTHNGSLEIETLHASQDRLEFNVTRCRYAEMYREMGLGRIGHLLSCNRDGDFCIGYNPQMELTRTQTIMKGASHCDFRYRMKEEAENGR
ncbi:MAG: L-2-amino-thiazoline-4-carboxylic acid hydrolase [Paracoccus sp. (in: a-proteobacteria)]|nr:L-2-amino-thiazoline-4-carboxylic acid hydrolase [Paracoccus sp. (in: a-proteobacteria)]